MSRQSKPKRKKSGSPIGRGARNRRRRLEPGKQATSGPFALRTLEVGALPLVNHILERMGLEELLEKHLPADDPRTELPTAQAIMVLVRNVLMSREPIYGVGEWAARFGPDLFGLWEDEVPLLSDDRLGRSLVVAFRGVLPQLVLAVTGNVRVEFKLGLDELHNDSTTVSFFGAYSDAAEEGQRGGRPTPAITWGHSKDHRPDLKQLLYTLTITNDGGVPVYFTTASGNVTDDRTHVATWDLLCQLVGNSNFLYVADCKLASLENMTHIATRGGRFVTVLPRNRKEDKQFRERLRGVAGAVRWNTLYEVKNKDGELVDRWTVCGDAALSSEGFRLHWYHSTRKAALDVATRQRRISRTLQALTELCGKLAAPRTRFRERQPVEQAVERLLTEHEIENWITVKIEQQEEAEYRQTKAGRPNPNTQYIKRTRDRYNLTWELNQEALSQSEREDGVFPLLTNDRELSAEAVLRAYKRQPLIEKRFSQFKTDFAVAPIYLQDVARIAGLLAVYFFALVAQTLLERELRRAMKKAGIKSLPLYPEDRPCARPTTHRLIELFEPIQRHELSTDGGEPEIMVTELTPVQERVIELLGLSPDEYGR
jgi:transposase